jgi:DNA-binding beta-propeller fold protein YncE
VAVAAYCVVAGERSAVHRYQNQAVRSVENITGKCYSESVQISHKKNTSNECKPLQQPIITLLLSASTAEHEFECYSLRLLIIAIGLFSFASGQFMSRKVGYGVSNKGSATAMKNWHVLLLLSFIVSTQGQTPTEFPTAVPTDTPTAAPTAAPTACPDQQLSTLAGDGTPAFSDATGTAAQFNAPGGVAYSIEDDYIAVADTGNNRIRLIVAATGVVTTLAGDGTAAFSDATGTAAQFNAPEGLAYSRSGITIAVADTGNNRIRLIVVSTGVVTTLAGDGTAAFADATGTAAQFSGPVDLEYSSDDSKIVVADTNNNRVRLIVVATAVVTTLAGATSGYADANGVYAQFATPKGVAFTADDAYIAVADTGNNRIRKVGVSSGTVTTIAGSGTAAFTDATGTSAEFSAPRDVQYSPDDTILIVSDAGNNRLRLIDMDTFAVTVEAGDGTAATTNGIGTSAQINSPGGISYTTLGTNVGLQAVVVGTGENLIRIICTATEGTVPPTSFPTSSPTSPTNVPTATPTEVYDTYWHTRYKESKGQFCDEHRHCNGHGVCSDDMTRTCNCFEGWGAFTDITNFRSGSCITRVCPSGRAWVDVPTATTVAHAAAECSNMGLCDRSTGRCACFDGFTGDACQRLMCPTANSQVCSGHGQCLNMKRTASVTSALPLSDATTYTGSDDSTTWDAEKVYGCVCDSSWAVGLGSGQTQQPEWFGPDCSMRRCPTGDDPNTRNVDETDCSGTVAHGKFGTGATNNLCHVDCSNRGICDYDTGLCKCFVGYHGKACATKSHYTGQEGYAPKVIERY